MDRYGNQFATRVEKNVEVGTIGVDLVIVGAWYRIMAGGVVLSPMFYTKEDAIDAAEVILDRLYEGVLLVEPMPEEYPPCGCCGGSFLRGASLEYCDACLGGECNHEDDYPGDVLPTGWDARDHKAMYE